MDIYLLALFGLATWRVSSLLVNESGPFHAFQKLREITGIAHVDEVPVMIPDRFFAQLFSCTWCTSVWVGAGWLLAWCVTPELSPLLAAPFAFSAVAVLIDNCVSK